MQMMMSHGFRFDVKAATNLYVRLSQRKIELNDELQTMFLPDTLIMKSTFWKAGDDLFDTKKEALAAGHKAKEITKGPNKTKAIPFNPGSRDHIADRLQRLGWEPSVFTEEGKPKVDEAVLSAIKIDHPSVKMLKEFLMLVKRMGQVAEGRQAWLTSEKGGRMYGRINTNGAVTGRCTHSRPNMAQVPRAGSPYGEECRALFKATEGATLIGCDASGLELRCLAHYLHPYDGGDYANKILQEDIHTVNQNAAGLPTRDAAKTFIYAFLYGAGDEKIGKIIGKGRGAGRAIKETFLQRLPALASLKACISNALSAREWLKGLDGRRLYIRSAHSALNCLLQGAGAIVMKQATVHLYEKLTDAGLEHGEDYGFVAHVHDEFQLEAKPQHVDLITKESVNAIRQAGTTLGFKCPLDGEARAGSTWAETH
jgi:DNA polymerase I-like protein with 3'-5' exonuclease and polymerase domains